MNKNNSESICYFFIYKALPSTNEPFFKLSTFHVHEQNLEEKENSVQLKKHAASMTSNVSQRDITSVKVQLISVVNKFYSIDRAVIKGRNP